MNGPRLVARKALGLPRRIGQEARFAAEEEARERRLGLQPKAPQYVKPHAAAPRPWLERTKGRIAQFFRPRTG
jgi:hypothetical protein